MKSEVKQPILCVQVTWMCVKITSCDLTNCFVQRLVSIIGFSCTSPTIITPVWIFNTDSSAHLQHEPTNKCNQILNPSVQTLTQGN